MKIGLFTDTYFPQVNGVATSVSMLEEYLEMQGHDVYVFTTTDPDAPLVEKNVYRIPSIPFSNIDRRVATFIYPQLTKTIKELKLDLIHTHTEFSIGILGRRAARTFQIPLVHTMHTIYEHYTHYAIKSKKLSPITCSLARKITSSFCNSADKVIAPTQKTKDLLLRYGVYREIAVIPTGIKLDKFSADLYSIDQIADKKEKIGLNLLDKVVINIGRISAEKNLDQILTYMKPYLLNHQDVKLVFIGDGPERNNLELLAAKLEISNQVIFAGEQPWDDIGLYYNLADVFVSASMSETQGLTYIEALAASIPILVKLDPCLEKVIKDGVNGYVFNDKQEFLDRLDFLLTDSEHYKYLANNATQSAKKFSVNYFGDSVISLYKDVIERRKYDFTESSDDLVYNKVK